MTDIRTPCQNCSAPLHGDYCSQCGQRDWPGGLTFGAVAGELFDDIFSWDSRIWRTLVALVFRPGFLTAEFLAGRRARYVPPFRLYLIISFVLFLVVSLVAATTDYVHIDSAAPAAAPDFAPAEGAVATAPRAAPERDPVAPGSAVTLDIRPHARAVEGGKRELVVAPLAVGDTEGDAALAADIGISLSDEDSPQWLKDLDQRLEDNAEKLEGDPGQFVDQLIEYLPQMMFILLPVFALLLKFNYLFSPYNYLEHLVFSLHFYSFAYLLYLFGTLFGTWIGTEGIGAPLFLVFVIYLPLALMRTYGSSLVGAAGKSLVILALDAILLLVAFILIALLTLALI